MRFVQHAISAGAVFLLALSAHAKVGVGGPCDNDTDCITGCCGSQAKPPVCLAKGVKSLEEKCDTKDGCDCQVGLCIEGSCPGASTGELDGEECKRDKECASGCCGSQIDPNALCIAKGVKLPREKCQTKDGCDCRVGLCIEGRCPDCGPDVPCPPSYWCCLDGTCVEDSYYGGTYSATPAPGLASTTGSTAYPSSTSY